MSITKAKSTIKVSSIVMLLILITACTTYTIDGSKTKSVADLSAPRVFKTLRFGIPRQGWPAVFSAVEVKSSFEATHLFVNVIADTAKEGGRAFDGLYIDTAITDKDTTNPFLAILSVLTVGIIPMRIEYEYQVKSTVYIDRKPIKTYHDTISTASMFSVLFPTPLLFGHSEQTMQQLFAARYVSNLLTKIHSDGTAFDN